MWYTTVLIAANHTTPLSTITLVELTHLIHHFNTILNSQSVASLWEFTRPNRVIPTPQRDLIMQGVFDTE